MAGYRNRNRNRHGRGLKRKKYLYRKRRKKGLRMKKLPLLFLLFIALALLCLKVEMGPPLEKLANVYLRAEDVQAIMDFARERKEEPYVYMAAYLAHTNYELGEVGDVEKFLGGINFFTRRWYRDKYEDEGWIIKRVYAIVEDFPVTGVDQEDYYYTDTYGAERTYGGVRKHLGTDVMDKENESGRLAIKSMTSGLISNIGWNEKGGWRIGIDSVFGDYYYYAHMDRYVGGLEVGDKIDAGQVIGYMGDTGYGKEPGTRGKFDVHLHMGIMLRGIGEEEYWINPYHILRYAQLVE